MKEEGGQHEPGRGWQRVFEGPDYDRTRREVLRRLFGAPPPEPREPEPEPE